MTVAGLVADGGLPISSDLLMLVIFAAVTVIGALIKKFKGEDEQQKTQPRPGQPTQKRPQRRPDGSVGPATPRRDPLERPPARQQPPARPTPRPPIARPAPRSETPATPYPPRPTRPADGRAYDLDELRARQERARRAEAEAEAERARRRAAAEAARARREAEGRRTKPTQAAPIEQAAEIEDIEDIESLPALGREKGRGRQAAMPALAREVADPLHHMLGCPAGLQAGFVLSEILSPPVALRERHLR
jgi:hypothetical protein